MADNKKIPFQLTFPENLKRGTNLSTTDSLAFDDLSDFVEERKKIIRILDRAREVDLKVDYSNFANHVFFDSAVSKFNIAKSKILTEYPFNGTAEEKDAFHLTGSAYEQYIFDQWPRYVGYVDFDGTSQYISASDTDRITVLTTSSLYVSSWIRPKISNINMILQVVSSSAGLYREGYELYLSGANDPYIKFGLYSGSVANEISAAYSSYTASFNNVAVIYDTAADLLSLYINNNRIASQSVTIGSIEFVSDKIYIGSGSQGFVASASYDYYSGSINEVRIAHTASELWHYKNYNRPINAEDYVVLNYTFNEGVTGTGSVDQVVVDYSQNGLHGKILNYDSTVRVSGSVMITDPGDPILYSFHSGVVAFTSSYINSGSLYDAENNNNIFNLIPPDVLREDDQQEGLIRGFSLGMARFFDDIKLYIDQFDNLRITNYEDKDETPDLFLPHLTRYFGWKVTEHFENADPLEFFFGDGVLVSGSMELPLVEIRNQFWRRILNNLPYLMQTKGKRYNLDAFFNALGINKENINIKEYGYLPGGSIEDTRIHKEKAVSMLGIGTGSLTGSYVKVSSLVGATPYSSYTVESTLQLPYASASYFSTSTAKLTGSIWQLVEQGVGSVSLLWNVNSAGNTTGRFILTGSDGQVLTSSAVSVFDGDIVHVAAGLDSSQIPFIAVRTLDNDTIDLTSRTEGAAAFDRVFTGSNYDLVIGSNSGSFFERTAQGYFGEVRYWTRPLSGSELDAHTYHFENVGIADPAESPNPLRGHWPLAEHIYANASGLLTGVLDLSRNGFGATGYDFLANQNPYEKFLLEYNYLSPSIDLKWTENKVRIRNKTELLRADAATDTNEISLEFNLVDALNRDISKIFSTIEVINNAVGAPVNKYRDEYADLESYRRVYFDRLGDSIYFNRFFNLFRWFDKKISDSIKQLLPTRAKFIGGEQVVESHFLERPRYGYKYPIFRTPVTLPEVVLTGNSNFDATMMHTLPASSEQAAWIAGTTERHDDYSKWKERESTAGIEGTLSPRPITTFTDGSERADRLSFHRTQYSGDTRYDRYDSSSGINYKNEIARKTLQDKDRDGE